MLKLHLLIVQLLFIPFSALNSNLFESVIISFIVIQLFIEVMNRLIAGNIQELSSVGYDNYSVFACADIIL